MKSKIKKSKYAQGGQVNPWEIPQSPYQYQGYEPIYMDPNQYKNFNINQSIEPQGQMEVLPQQMNQPSQPSNNRGNSGSMAAGVGRAAGQVLNALTVGGPQLINALLPEQNLERENRNLQRAYTQYPQGTGSQAIYRNGGYVERVRKAGKKGNIEVTEEIPEELMYKDNLQPISSNPIPFSFSPKQVSLPQTSPYRELSYETLYDVDRQPTGYAPQFQGYSYDEARQILPQLPQSFGGLPVTRNIEQYRDLYSGFLPNTQSPQWMNSPLQDYYPQSMDSYEFGGTMAYRSDGVAPNPNATKNYPFMPKYKQGGKMSKGCKNGGYIENTEIDLSPAEVRELLNSGYDIEIL